MIEAKNISFGYSWQRDKNVLLDNINLSIEAGSSTALMGPNGAGKSTLLKIFSGQLKAHQGEIIFNNKNLQDWRAIEKAQMMAVLAQENVLEFNFTVTEVVTLGRSPHNSGRIIDQDIVTTALNLVDAGQLAQRYYPHLSGGEKQRVNLARVLAQVWQTTPVGPRLLILDEPSAAFDLAHQQLLNSIIKEIVSHKVTVLMVVHDLNLAARIVDNIVLLNQGTVQATGTPHQVLTEATIAQVFGIKTEVFKHPETGLPTILI
ncbi:MAG: heme ABC transporter ATP-binding protein [Pseudomonadales bacterium]|nr:heme ABC transporter ATP-binding protein [Pseudomonadales bacterium]